MSARLPVAEYGFPGPLRDRLVAAILAGRKRTTTALLAEFEAGGQALPAPGDRELVVDSEGGPVCVTEVTGVQLLPLGEVGLEHAVGEGEGYESVAQWRAGHERFWRDAEYAAWFRSLGAPPPALDGSTIVVCVRFEVVARVPPGHGPRSAFSGGSRG
ncbi:ASCH domain-containing protein [Actinomyces bowdenii]|uniref:ASCH domain-containing protein n=1 Tax=Actinomyces bowdenii TaxID=131109 RepID=UPI001ABCBC09|nr:ASCH domain-containing protein [Actinomyces bowdenii]MBO3725526.1 ASCH domain-containing protein [Actinomyces bowdenii]